MNISMNLTYDSAIINEKVDVLERANTPLKVTLIICMCCTKHSLVAIEASPAYELKTLLSRDKLKIHSAKRIRIIEENETRTAGVHKMRLPRRHSL